MVPGATTLAVIPRPPSSREIERARPTRPAFDAADEDDAPATLADHPGRRAAGAAEGTGEVGVDDGVELLVAHAHEQRVAGDAGIRDEHLDRTAEDLLGGRERRVDGGRVGDLARDALQPL